MKKLFLLLVVVASAFAFSSCAKSYVCTQTTTSDNVSVSDATTYDALTAKEKTDIENLGTYSYITGGGTTVTVKTECK